MANGRTSEVLLQLKAYTCIEYQHYVWLKWKKVVGRGDPAKRCQPGSPADISH